MFPMLSLGLEAFYQAGHVLQPRLQTQLLISHTIQLSAQVSNVALKHTINAGLAAGLFL